MASHSKQFRRASQSQSDASRLLYRLGGECALIFGAVAGAYLLLALATYSPADPSWTHSADAGKAVANWGGALGANLAAGLRALFGASAYLTAALVFLASILLMRRFHRGGGKIDTLRIIATLSGFCALLLCASSLETLRLYSVVEFAGNFGGGIKPGGAIGFAFANYLLHALGFTGATLFLIAGAMCGASLFGGFSWLAFFDKFGWATLKIIRIFTAGIRMLSDRRRGRAALHAREATVNRARKIVASDSPAPIEPSFSVKPSRRAREEKQNPLFKRGGGVGELPPLSLLAFPPNVSDAPSAESLEYTARLIEKKLLDFGVEVKVEAIHPGPVITRFEIQPATGVKGAQIVGLVRDLARALSVTSIRVLETIAGKSCMGLEIPNPRRETVHLAEMLSSEEYAKQKSPIVLALGKDISGRPFVADLSKMPHLLVAGTTGAGKSVSLNAMLMSILYKASPSDARLILIDPKMLELSVYQDIPHLLAPVVTDMTQAHLALNWCVEEMERRYRLMAAVGVRHIDGFNQKIQDAEARGESLPPPPALSSANNESAMESLPCIVVIIDELADLMMVAGKKVEQAISRLAQKARAAGIHLILATQRPSVDVITGLIKANISARIAFQVSSRVDSRTILDQGGAEALLGKGDMLYLSANLATPQRVHGAFVSDEEVHNVVAHIKEKSEANYLVDFSCYNPSAGNGNNEGGGGNGFNSAERDPLYDEAVEVVIQTRRASISLVQRKLRIGYNRAARLVEEMESAGLVSAMDDTGARKVLAPQSKD